MQWREFAEQVIEVIGFEKKDAAIVFVSDAAIRKLNQRFRSRNYPTDVLSFPIQAASFESENKSNLGDVVISVERAAAQARNAGHSFSAELKQLILHGLLHLCGYDHETDDGEMNRLELRLRRRLGI